MPKKYEGLDGTELAISESQERMAVVVSPENVKPFLALADEENLQAVPVAVVTEEPRLIMHWNGKEIVNLRREFLNSNGAEKHITVEVEKTQPFAKQINIPAIFVDIFFQLLFLHFKLKLPFLTSFLGNLNYPYTFILS